MLSHEDDPHDEVLVPVDQGGRIHLYGVTFEPHEVKVVDDENPIKGTEEERYEGIQDEGKEKGITRNMMVDVKENIDINEYHTNKTVDKIHETVEVIDFAEISKIEVLDYSPIVRKSPIKKKINQQVLQRVIRKNLLCRQNLLCRGSYHEVQFLYIWHQFILCVRGP